MDDIPENVNSPARALRTRRAKSCLESLSTPSTIKVQPRRSTRTPKPIYKNLDTSYSYESPETSKKSSQKAVSEEMGAHSKDSDSDESPDQSPIHEKPHVLHQNESVEGNKLFAFQARKTRRSLLVKAMLEHEQIPKTPHALRSKLKKQIEAKLMEENESSDGDFSDSGSEFEASESEDEESSDSKSEDSKDSDEDEEKGSEDEVEESEDEEEEIEVESPKKEPPRQAQKNIFNPKKVSKQYTIKTDDYFSNHSSKKILTSNHTLDKLNTPRLPQDHLHQLLSKIKISKNHKEAMESLAKSTENYFSKWLHLLHENFNILLYGLGCKRGVMHAFQEQCLKNKPVIVVNGFFPSLTMKDILDSIIVDLLELKENPANQYEACDVIEKQFSFIPDTHLYILIHNIELLRTGKSQNVLARLAAVKNIHLVVSIDHINGPLIWDHSKLSRFNFTWWDVTSYKRYLDETSFESSMMVQRSGNLALSSLRNVFLSLTSNSKGIYLTIVKYQIENSKDQYYQGMAFRDLYSACREGFLVSSDLALRAQLTEFVDHKMLKFKRGADGTEYLQIPITNTLLQQFLTEQSTQ